MKKSQPIKPLIFLSLAALWSCQSFKPDTVNITTYPEIGKHLGIAPADMMGRALEKEVWLDGQNERKTLNPDTSEWKKELSFLKEIDPNQSAYVGAFDLVKNGSLTELTLKPEEKGSLKRLTYQPTESGASISAVIHEDKDVFTYHEEINIIFSEGMISSYSVDGYQKIMMKDTIRFSFSGKIL